jgi:hypothetical protein
LKNPNPGVTWCVEKGREAQSPIAQKATTCPP